nr:LacI family DNA-binding transcriptional regulator [Ammoniphilus sp. YIM 78166]
MLQWRNDMTITIKDVALEAGVSIATVSRVINGKDRVKLATKKKVEEVIKKLNFKPDNTARTMIVKETKTIGLIVPSLNEYWARISEVIQERLWESGYALMLCATGGVLFEKERFYLNSFIERKVDGIIYCGRHSERDAIINDYLTADIPIITFDRKIDGIDRVFGDHMQGAMKAVEHLIRLGHQKIAYIGGPLSFPDRELGYRNAHTVNGLSVDEALLKRGDFRFEFGYLAAEELLRDKLDFTAIFCGNDLIAFGVIEALKKASIRVPEDIAIVGYDDIQMASLVKPALTTVRQPIVEMGCAIVELLKESMKNQNHIPKNLMFPMELIVRESCGAAHKKM